MSLASRVYRGIARTLIKPYVSAEGPGWGYLYRYFIGHAERDWLWQDAGFVAVRDKNTGYVIERNLSWWSDRLSYFLSRWHALDPQLIARDFIRPGDCVLDVGANRGDFSLFASKLVGAAGSVMSFEPNPPTAELFERAVSANNLPNVKLFKIGLSDQEAQLELTIPKFSSGEASFGKAQYASSDVYSIAALVRVGDDIIGRARPSLIKVDVEGFEIRALTGLKKTISAAKPIIITEFVSKHMMRCDSTPAELTDLMTSLGYVGYVPDLTPNKMSWTASPLQTQDNCDVVWVIQGSAAEGHILRQRPPLSTRLNSRTKARRKTASNELHA